jgi:hypothetical protein
MFAPVDPESHERRQKRAARFLETSNNSPSLFGSLLDNLNSSVRLTRVKPPKNT